MSVQLIIPMSGLGSRFLNVGYSNPKPLIQVHNRPMIEWVMRMFPDTMTTKFICRREHLENTEMFEILNSLKPDGQIIPVDGAKLGPVGALISAFDQIEDEKPTIVSYCDFYMIWSYSSFLSMAMRKDWDGGIPCYSGFHPHLIPEKNLYASCSVNAENELVEIREKYSFEQDKMQSLHSPGVYYFKNGKLLKYYCRALVESGETVGGEYYVSLVYNRMVKDGLKVGVPNNVEYFCQWGTPYDLEEYLYWVKLVAGNLK